VQRRATLVRSGGRGTRPPVGACASCTHLAAANRELKPSAAGLQRHLYHRGHRCSDVPLGRLPSRSARDAVSLPTALRSLGSGRGSDES
jgi:hypothetical protein